MKTVIADFQESDGVFSSFICDEIAKRLTEDLKGSLLELEDIEKKSRMKAFRICLSPEDGGPPGLMENIENYANDFPELILEIKNAAEDAR